MADQLSLPGWYPDPAGAHAQRYFDGTTWTDQIAPWPSPQPAPVPSTHPTLPRQAKSPRPFVMLAIIGPVVAIVAFVLMQLAFGAAADGTGSGSLWLEIVGFVLFVVWLASIVVTVVGVIGALVRLLGARSRPPV